MGLSSCAHVTIPNQEICGNNFDGSASCFNTLKTDERELSQSEWDSIRPGWLSMSGNDYGEIKTALEKLCHSVGPTQCTFEDQSKMGKLFERIRLFRNQ